MTPSDNRRFLTRKFRELTVGMTLIFRPTCCLKYATTHHDYIGRTNHPVQTMLNDVQQSPVVRGPDKPFNIVDDTDEIKPIRRAFLTSQASNWLK